MSNETTKTTTVTGAIFDGDGAKEILDQWVREQLEDMGRAEGVSDNSITASSNEFIKLFSEAVRGGNVSNIQTNEWEPVLRMLADLSASRALQGSTSSDTAKFIFSLKQVIFEKINADGSDERASAKTESISEISRLLDKLGLYTIEIYQKSREAIIRRQQRDMLEMSTPVIKLWDKILAVPLIGTLDSARTQIVMENLLQGIVDNGAKIAILDITGVPTVDTQTAQHLMKTVSATRLMGAECIISGIRPQIAQTIVHLGIEINDITTKATMADAFREALAKTGFTVESTLQLDKAK